MRAFFAMLLLVLVLLAAAGAEQDALSACHDGLLRHAAPPCAAFAELGRCLLRAVEGGLGARHVPLPRE